MILITGGNGQLGYDLAKECERRKLDYLKVDSQDMDITDPIAVDTFFNTHTIDSVIHCAAFTAVDLAEDEKDKCMLVNVKGTQYLAQASQKHHLKFLYVSTDYVFDGTKKEAYLTTDLPNPQSVYGKSKYEGELVVQSLLKQFFIVRIAWVFGLNGKNFVKTMLRIGKDKESVNVVSDQIGSPTYTKDVARLMIDIILSEKYGVYHATNDGTCSWALLTEKIFEEANYSTKVNFIQTKDYPTKAKRPQNSRLSKDSLINAGFTPLPNWQDALKRYILELKEHGEFV